jgi:hypothetical protein
MEFSTRSNEKKLTERKMTPDKGGDVYMASTSTHSDQDVWLIDSKASYHMTPHTHVNVIETNCLPWRLLS